MATWKENGKLNGKCAYNAVYGDNYQYYHSGFPVEKS